MESPKEYFIVEISNMLLLSRIKMETYLKLLDIRIINQFLIPYLKTFIPI